MGLGFPVKAGRRTGPGSFGEGCEVLFDEPLACALDRGHAGRYLLGNLFIRQSLIRFQ
jgi:hypothetical protein